MSRFQRTLLAAFPFKLHRRLFPRSTRDECEAQKMKNEKFSFWIKHKLIENGDRLCAMCSSRTLVYLTQITQHPTLASPSFIPPTSMMFFIRSAWILNSKAYGKERRRPGKAFFNLRTGKLKERLERRLLLPPSCPRNDKKETYKNQKQRHEAKITEKLHLKRN